MGRNLYGITHVDTGGLDQAVNVRSMQYPADSSTGYWR
jgi:hypothetical protein